MNRLHPLDRTAPEDTDIISLQGINGLSCESQISTYTSRVESAINTEISNPYIEIMNTKDDWTDLVLTSCPAQSIYWTCGQFPSRIKKWSGESKMQHHDRPILLTMLIFCICICICICDTPELKFNSYSPCLVGNQKSIKICTAIAKRHREKWKYPATKTIISHQEYAQKWYSLH